MAIFKFSDYRPYIVERIKALPKGGRGEFQKIATALAMHTSTVSQVFSGQKSFTAEQGSKLSEHFGFSDLEADYLLNLIEKERAGTPDLKKRIEKRLQKIREMADQLIHRLPQDQVLSDQNKAIFYSNWYYSAISLATDIQSLQTVEALSDHFSLPPTVVNEALRFLVGCGLCVETGGRFRMGTQRTHLEATSPLVSRHHMNWRQKAIERSPRMNHAEELQFSSAIVLSKKDAKQIRQNLLDQVQEILKISAPSVSEEIYCLNIDWIKAK